MRPAYPHCTELHVHGGHATVRAPGLEDEVAVEEPLEIRVLCVSGRLSFELVQKAAVAGAPLLVGVGAPTSLAVWLAEHDGG
jgi:formate dehydrogenase assembly factor FdhD